MSADLVPLESTYRPVKGVIPTGLLAVDTISNSQTAMTNQAEYTWRQTPVPFNIQGQKWEQDVRATFFGPQTYNGCRQVSTPRLYSAPAAGMKNQHYQHTAEFEFFFVGTKFSIRLFNSGGNGSSGQPGGDVKMYLEYGGDMYKASQHPLTVTRSDGSNSFRNVTFSEPYVGRIRLVFGATTFHSILTDGSSLIFPTPPQPFGIADGDSYFESSQALAANSTTGWFTDSIIDFLYEKTGIVWARRAQGATGFFVNGVGQVFDDTVASVTSVVPALPFITVTIGGVSRTMSASRSDWMTRAAEVMAAQGRTPFIQHAGEDFGQPLGRRPLVYLLNGTWNDASAGGVTEEQMYARAKEVYQYVSALDPNCTIVHVSPEPFDDTLFGNAIGPPRVGDKSEIHVRGQMRAAAEVPRTHYINAFGPDLPERWWTGHGPDTTQGVPTDSQQAQLVSKEDDIHGTSRMNNYFAGKIAEKMGKILVPAGRVNGSS